MKEKERLILWEIAMAFIAIGGISNLIAWMPKAAIGGMLGIALVIILITGTIRFLAARFPIKVYPVTVDINTFGARNLLGKGDQGGWPMIEIEMTFFSTDEVRISRTVILKLDEDIESELRKLGKLKREFNLQIKNREDTKPFIMLHTGEAIETSSARPLQMVVPFTKEIDKILEDITSRLEGKFTIGWQELGHKISWYKPVREKGEL